MGMKFTTQISDSWAAPPVPLPPTVEVGNPSPSGSTETSKARASRIKSLFKPKSKRSGR